MTTATMTLGELTNQRHRLREQKRALEAEVKAIDAELKDNELALIDALDNAGLDATRVDGISVSISEQVMPNVEDWDAFEAFIFENKALYLLQRRAATGPYREMLQMEQPVPGVTPFTKRSINMSKR